MANHLFFMSFMSEQSPQNKNGKPTFYNPQERRIRSFVTRAGRLSSGQERAITELGSTFCIPFSDEFLDYEQVFNKQGDVILEIGFGMS